MKTITPTVTPRAPGNQFRTEPLPPWHEPAYQRQAEHLLIQCFTPDLGTKLILICPYERGWLWWRRTLGYRAVVQTHGTWHAEGLGLTPMEAVQCALWNLKEAAALPQLQKLAGLELVGTGK